MLQRIAAISYKEFVQIRRDKMTFTMLIGITVMYLMLFGFAINPDPKHLPTLLVAERPDEFSRLLSAGLIQSGYFDIRATTLTPRQASLALQTSQAMMVIQIPESASRDIMHGLPPILLLEVDATDPVSVNNAVNVFEHVSRQTLARFRRLHHLDTADDAAVSPDSRILRRYNPEASTQHNVVPGLLGVILTMTMVLMTALSVTREKERGTIEALLITPVKPWEVICGKILPYLAIGLVQTGIILTLALRIFHVPLQGSPLLLAACLLLFITANLTQGITFSILARSQMQAMQMTFFFFLPSILLSGFMFPFSGMPGWAKLLALLLPLTHFQRIARGIMLKGNTALEIWPHIWPILLFMLLVCSLGLLRYRKTLD
ncbi:ABC transporter permease [Vogesella sp. LIG4]|uniref:ABC transporter permease n=1 Tax=Vogesella sp. LIG4 TaxID=1192162 RepID=UPI00082007E6|nr:ABC transporter permease [Vogesella sp. LIG4]SCK08430.1 ABC-2 type transport system permease protein [Vogesella sp. LIG4]